MIKLKVLAFLSWHPPPFLTPLVAPLCHGLTELISLYSFNTSHSGTEGIGIDQPGKHYMVQFGFISFI